MMRVNTSFRRASVIAATLACAVAGGPVRAQDQSPPRTPDQSPPQAPDQSAPRAPDQSAADDTVTLNFVNADIVAVVKAVGEMTGRNFLIDPRVQGTVNIIAPKPVPRALVFPILLSALRVQGFAAVGGDLGYVNIVPESDAKFYSGPRDPRRARGDQIVTEVFKLQYESATQLVPLLRPLIAPNNVINAFPATNMVVVTDYAANVERVRKVITTVDQPQPAELMTLTLRYAAAVDLGQAIQRLMPETVQPTQPGAAPRVALSVDSRTNSLLVRAENPALAKRIRELAGSMDVPSAAGGNIHVVYLRNAEAIRLAESLRAMVTGQPAPRALASGVSPGSPGTPSPAGPQQVAQQGGAGLPPGGGGTPAIGALANVSIQPYPETNSLVIIAPDSVYQSLRGVIDKLDARRAQVFVEALIVEIATTKAAEFGIQWQSLSGGETNATKVVGGTNFTATPNSNIVAAAADFTTLGPGLNLGVIKGTLTIAGKQILNLSALVRALEQDTTANILSTPQLLTLDNEEAKIIVGQNIPIVTGSFTLAAATGGGSANPFQTFERRDIGVTLKVRPQIAEGGTVKMAVYEEVSSIFNANNPSGIILNKRSLESQVLIDDGQIIVLGGLLADEVDSNNQSVPVLGNIPILGALFRYDSRSRTKTNLMIFLRPVILRDANTAATLSGDRYDVIRGIQGGTQLPERLALPPMPGPTLPPPQQLPSLPNAPASPPASPPGSPPGSPASASPASASVAAPNAAAPVDPPPRQ